MTNNDKQHTTNNRGANGGADSFRDLVVWQRAQELASDVLDVLAGLPANRLSSILTDQAIRSVTSIGANIAEGHGRYTPGSYRQHLSIARGSTAEAISWIDLLQRRKLITPHQSDSLLASCAEIMKMLTTMMIQLEKPVRSSSRGPVQRGQSSR